MNVNSNARFGIVGCVRIRHDERLCNATAAMGNGATESV